MSEKHEGGCVCGGVRFVVDGEPARVTICHCAWCQKRTGTAFGTETAYKTEQLTFTGDSLRKYRHISDESGRWLDQHFCSNCGTNLGLSLEAVPGLRTVATGTFDDPSWIKSDKYSFRYVYVRSAQDWSELPDDVEQYEVHFRT